MKTLKKILIWFKQAFEGNDGKASHQKLLVFYMCLLFTYVIYTEGTNKYTYSDSVYQIIAGVIVGQSAIRAWQTVKFNETEKKYNKEENDN